MLTLHSKYALLRILFQKETSFLMRYKVTRKEFGVLLVSTLCKVPSPPYYHYVVRMVKSLEKFLIRLDPFL